MANYTVNYYFTNWAVSVFESLAELEPIPKSEHWYTGLAWILMEAATLEATEMAVHYFKKALEISPEGWVAFEGLARC